jgi:hypothetical protein
MCDSEMGSGILLVYQQDLRIIFSKPLPSKISLSLPNPQISFFLIFWPESWIPLWLLAACAATQFPQLELPPKQGKERKSNF